MAQAFENLVTLHILFRSQENDVAPSAVIDDLSLTLDDEVQYRCAGFIQAEMERFAELTGAHGPSRSADGSNASDDDSEDEVAANATKGDKSRSGNIVHLKHVHPFLKFFMIVMKRPNSQGELEREYEFIAIISTFLRAIRSGTIHVSHAAVMLSHYGTLGMTFDSCCKAVVEVLRDEGMYNDNASAVSHVVVTALEEVRGVSSTVYLWIKEY